VAGLVSKLTVVAGYLVTGFEAVVGILTGPLGIIAGLVLVGVYWDEITAKLREWAPESWVRKWDKLVALFNETFPEAIQYVTDIWEGFKILWADSMQYISNEFSLWKDSIVKSLKDAWPTIKSTLMEWGQWILKYNPITGPILFIMDNFKPQIEKALDTVWTAIKGFFDKIERWIMRQPFVRKIMDFSDKLTDFFGKAIDIVFGEETVTGPAGRAPKTVGATPAPLGEPELQPKNLNLQVPDKTPVLMEKPVVESVATPQRGMPAPKPINEISIDADLSELSPKKTNDLLDELVTLTKKSNELQERRERILKKLSEPTRGRAAGGSSSMPGLTENERAVLAGMGQ